MEIYESFDFDRIFLLPTIEPMIKACILFSFTKKKRTKRLEKFRALYFMS